MSSRSRILLLATLPFTSHAFSSSVHVRTHLSPGTGTIPRGESSSVFALSHSRRSKIVLQADSLSLRSVDRRERSHKKRRAKWHRRMWSKIVGREASRKSTSTSLHMQAIDEETEALMDAVTNTYNEDFILRNFQDLTPDMVLTEVSPSDIDSEFFDVSITERRTSPELSMESTSSSSKQRTAPRNISISRLMGLLFENILTGIIERNAVEEPENLLVQASPRGNVVASLLRGRFSTDAKVDVGRLCFRNIRMSSGTLEIKRMTLNVMGFLPSQRQSSSRFPKQFDLHADDFTFSRHDLLFSRCIRNGLQNLLVRILRDRGVQSSSIKVTSLDILSSGKISCKGEAKTLFGSPMSFEVRSGIATSGRGHILTFPGLELSLNRDIGLFVPVIVPNLDLDVGHNARFRNIEIDGKQKLLRLSASVTITPASTIRLNDYVQSREAFAAKFSTDVGQWLTRIGNFSK